MLLHVLFVCVMLFFTIDLGRDQKSSEAGKYV